MSTEVPPLNKDRRLAGIVCVTGSYLSPSIASTKFIFALIYCLSRKNIHWANHILSHMFSPGHIIKLY